MLCKVCSGRGSLFCMNNEKPEFWDCPCCGGDGVRVLYAPRLIGPGSRRKPTQ